MNGRDHQIKGVNIAYIIWLIHVYIYICMYIIYVYYICTLYMYIVFVYVYICTYLYKYICVYMCIYVYIYMYTYVCIYIYIPRYKYMVYGHPCHGNKNIGIMGWWNTPFSWMIIPQRMGILRSNLVGGWPPPLKNMSSSDWLFPIYENIKFMFQTTNQQLPWPWHIY